MKHQAYFTRALQAKDPRFAAIFGKLGYETKAEPEATPDRLSELRDQYKELSGKNAFHGWDVATLEKKIAAIGAD